MKSACYPLILNQKKRNKQIAVLIDPDKFRKEVIEDCEKAGVDFYFVGGSLITKGLMDKTILSIRKISRKPVFIFPGDSSQISKHADAFLLLSLVSGRNPELLIGQHVKAAIPLLKSKLEIIPTAYLMIDGGKITSALYMSGTLPIPADKNEIALSTALAAQMLGFKLIYLEAGSGASNNVPAKMINQLKKNIQIPLMVGGGIDSAAKATKLAEAGADIIVVGNALEKDSRCIFEITKALRKIKV